MPSSSYPNVKLQFSDSLGRPISGGKLYSYASGTLTPLTTYTDAALTQANANPVILDAAGRAVVFLQSAAYKFILQNALGVVQWTADGITDGAVLLELSLSGSSGSSSVGFLQTGTGAVATTAQSKMRQEYSALDFMTAAQIADVTGNIGAVDVTTAINTALTACGVTGRSLFCPAGTYRTSATLVVPANVLMYGVGRKTKILCVTTVATPNAECVRLSGDYAGVSNMWLRGPGQLAGDLYDGRRGVWIGSLADHTLVGQVNHCFVTDCIIDEFSGNGICGDFSFSKILHNKIINTTDAGMHIQPWCTNNVIDGNDCIGSHYSGIDHNGAECQIINNYCADNGGGVADLNSWCGILLANVNNTYPCEFNFISCNRIKNNEGTGIVVFGSTSGAINPARGNIVSKNIVSGHTVVTATAHIPAGIAVWGGNHTIVEGNVCYANRDNYVITGGGAATHCRGTIVANNQSIDATRHGFFFVHTPRVDLVGTFPALQVSIRGNFDWNAAESSYKFLASGATFDQYTIVDNRSFSPGTYCFENAAISLMYDYHFENNYGSDAGTAYQVGFDARNMAGATPDVVNGRVFRTINSITTTITNFTGGIAQQEIIILVNDNNSTYDFTGTNLKGNNGVDYSASQGDWLTCVYDGTNWYCTINAITGFPQGGSAGVTQATNKTTAVTVNSVAGAVTTNNAALAADAEVIFTMNNNKILGTNDQLYVKVNGGPNYGSYLVQATVTGVGTANISLRNVSTGSLSDAVIIGFKVLHQ